MHRCARRWAVTWQAVDGRRRCSIDDPSSLLSLCLFSPIYILYLPLYSTRNIPLSPYVDRCAVIACKPVHTRLLAHRPIDPLASLLEASYISNQGTFSRDRHPLLIVEALKEPEDRQETKSASRNGQRSRVWSAAITNVTHAGQKCYKRRWLMVPIIKKDDMTAASLWYWKSFGMFHSPNGNVICTQQQCYSERPIMLHSMNRQCCSHNRCNVTQKSGIV